MVGLSLLAAAILAAPPQQRPQPTVSIADLVEVTDIASLAASPDGRWVAFRTVRPSIGEDRYRLEWYVAPIDGSMPARPLASGGDPELNGGLVVSQSPVWAPSSRAFYFRAAIDGQVQVWRAPINGDAARRITSEASDIRSLGPSPDGRALTFEVGATRDEVARAEQDIKDKGVLIDGTTDVTASLSGNAMVNGHMATERFAKGWFTRQPLLWDKDVRSTRLSWSGDDFRAAAPTIPVGITVHIETKGDSQTLHWTDRGGMDHACDGPACPTARIRSAIVLPDGSDVLVTTADAERAETLWVWTAQSGRWRKLAALGGTLDGGTILEYPPCTIAGKALACVSAEPSGPPRLVAIDLATSHIRTLFDPNASLRARAWPAAVLRWKTSKGLEVGGQLMLPKTPRPAGGYPLVLTYYACDGFLRGGLGDELPLAPLAQAGIATLCINKALGAGDTERQTEDTAIDAISVIVDRLAGQGVIDRSRVGMSGLSFGSQVTMAMLERTQLIRAAAIASAQIEPYYYWVYGRVGRDMLPTLQSYYGLGDPDADRAGWRENSAIGRIERIKAPLLMQLPESEMRMAIETYGRLERTSTPVEMFAYPNETHIKWEPRHKLAVYQRNLDWFRYWLLGSIDPDPVKATQYDRWKAYSSRPGFGLPRDDHLAP